MDRRKFFAFPIVAALAMFVPAAFARDRRVRMSCESGDPNFHPRAHDCDGVWVDGELSACVITADEIRQEVLEFVRDETGKLLVQDGRAVKRWRRAKVKIAMTEEARNEVLRDRDRGTVWYETTVTQ